MTDRFYVTTPIYYPNDVPHVGHAYTTIAADVAARYHRLKGEDVWFLTGTDEHGQKMLRAAEERGMTPLEYLDGMIPRWTQLWSRLHISYDDFIRTTEERHETRVQRFWERLRETGDVYLGSYEGPYCVACEDFYKPEDLVEGCCPIHRTPVETVREENYFFKLSKYADWLLDEYYARDPAPVRPASRLNEVRSFVKQGLQDISISRTSFSWGVPIPWAPDHVFYVWIDALLNYVTALGFPEGEAFERFWPGVNFVGKDILRFHAVTWPAMLHAAGVEPPEAVFAHGWLLVGGEKMSKTKLTGIHPDELIDTFGTNAVRYYLMRDIPFGNDGSFSWEALQARYTAELANGIGNLASRILAMIDSQYGGEVPDGAKGEQDPERTLRKVVAASVERYEDAMDVFAFHDALDAVDAIVRHANGYLVETAPWKLAKDEATKPRAAAVLYASAEALRILAILLSPFMPDACGRLWQQLGIGEDLAVQRLPVATRWGGLAAGTRVNRGDPLFPRLDA